MSKKYKVTLVDGTITVTFDTLYYAVKATKSALKAGVRVQIERSHDN